MPDLNRRDLFDRRTVQEYFGGIHSATLYRWVRQGRVPRPIKMGSLSRWLRSECEAALAVMIEGRAAQ
jgi:predicted DNA-binding transcriptional regulator AlpA